MSDKGHEASGAASSRRGEGAPGGTPSARRAPGRDFVRAIVEEDLREGRHGGRVVTRFPPEPNGYLHIGHAKSLVLNFGIALEYGGRCHLRFDDTNPETEEMRYALAIEEDVRWMGYDWGEHLYFASDYFERMYECALVLIERGKAYVDSQSEEAIREGRGSLVEPGRESPFRTRPVEENLDLFRRMRAGEFENGAHVLRARIDMAHPNMIMRDPVLYRIRHASHYRTGDAWCIYPLYDYAHCLEDAFEDVTHSLCTLEFETNREIYDWILDEAGFSEPRTHQYEFARLNLEYTVLSKRRLLRLVREGHVAGWDDPRMPTLAGLRRAGVPPEAIRAFCEMIGVTKADSIVDIGKFEYALRDHLNRSAPRVMCVIRPLKVVITNYPEGGEEWLEAPHFPRDIGLEGSRTVPFSRELWIERDDFLADPPPDFYRMTPGREVRLRYGYVVRCDEAVTDPETGEVTEVRCSYDPDTRGGNTPDGRKVPGTIHWVSVAHALRAEVRLYDRLFAVPDPEDVPGGGDFIDHLNPASLLVASSARIEPSVADAPLATRFQFERNGYFWRDPVDGTGERLVFNRIVTLRDTWGARQEALAGKRAAPAEPPPPSDEAALASQGGLPVPAGGGERRREVVPRADAELATRMARYRSEWGLSDEDADLLTRDRVVSDFFEEAAREHGDPREAAAWVVNELPRVSEGRTPEQLPFGGGQLGRLLGLVAGGQVSRTAAREVLQEMASSGDAPDAIVERLGLESLAGDADLSPEIDAVLAEWPAKVSEYRGGKAGLLGFFVGQVVRRTGGKADPRRVKELLEGRLGAPAGDSARS